jgi:hypothetical protein
MWRATPDSLAPHMQLRLVFCLFTSYVHDSAREQMSILHSSGLGLHIVRKCGWAPQRTCSLPGDGTAAAACGGGARAAALDAGSTSGIAAASGESAILELFNKQASTGGRALQHTHASHFSVRRFL